MKKILTFFAAIVMCSFMGVSAKVYYITGNEALVSGNAWKADALPMSGDSTHTFQAMAAGTYEMKITDGKWKGDGGQEFSFDDVDVEKSSAGIKSKGSNHNIGFTVETPNNVVVAIANGVITITGTFKVDQPQPAGEKAYYIKNNWNGGSWEWQKMTPNADSTEWTYTGVYGGSGVNIADNADGNDAAWFEQNNITGNPTSGNEYTFTYNVANSTVSVGGETPGPGPGPQPGTSVKYYIKNNWKDGDWTWKEMTPNADSTEWTYTDTFGGSGVNIADNEQGSNQLWFSAENIAGNPVKGNEYTFTYNVANSAVSVNGETPGPGPGPQPSTGDKYYIKNCWNGGDWAWQEMTPNADSTEWTYTDTFGGTGVNINTKSDDGGAQWFPTEDITGNPVQGTEYTFTYNVANSTVSVGGETPGPGPGPGPQPGTVDYYLVGWINGADKGCGDTDWQTLDPDYKFVDGALSMTFTAASYVYVKTGDNANWYMCAEYVPAAESASATLMIAGDAVKEKLGVPADVLVNFTLVDNGDNTLTLSYTTGTSALGETRMNANQIKKMMIDGKLYIMREGKMYSVLGQE